MKKIEPDLNGKVEKLKKDVAGLKEDMHSLQKILLKLNLVEEKDENEKELKKIEKAME